MGTQSTWGLSLLQKVTPVKMKVLFIAATVALASAGLAPTCDECNAAAAGLLERLTSEAGLTMWWSDMAMCLFPAFIGGGDPCGQLGLCKVKSALGDWTCDDCTDIMTRVAEFMKKDETIAQGIAVLEG